MGINNGLKNDLPDDVASVEAWAARARSAAEWADMDRIFFESSATQQFRGPAERAAFRERWLGRFLTVDASHAFVAVERARVVGYVIGTLEDIATLPRFADLSSARAFASLSARFPAHLHINVDERRRGQGLGARLIETFAAHAVGRGSPGMHVVTSAGSRNVRFYERCGFHEAGRLEAASAGSATVFLARAFR